MDVCRYTPSQGFYYLDMSEKIICRSCGSVDDYTTEMKSNNLVATCNTCKRFIKNIPHDTPKMYVGRYKGKEIKDIDDVGYLKWAYENMNSLTDRQRSAVHERYLYLSNLLR